MSTLWTTLQQDLQDQRWIWIKGFGFLLIGILASTLLIIETLSIEVLFVHALAVWGFCRFYYFAFYVIEHYTDTNFKFSGLLSFVAYLLRKRKSQSAHDSSDADL